MDFNLTLIGQTIAMLVFVWFCMKYIWPPIMAAIEKRRKEIADGIAAGEKGQKELADARHGSEAILAEARQKAVQVVDIAHKRSSDLVGEAKNLAVHGKRAHRDGRPRARPRTRSRARATRCARKSRRSRSPAPRRCSAARWTRRRTRRSSTSWRRNSRSRHRHG